MSTVYVRFYGRDWRGGCFGMSLEQEGLYIRICAYIFDTGYRLPLNDSQASKFMGLHTNAYVKVRNQLAALGKLVRHDDGWTVARAEKERRNAEEGELAAARKHDGAALPDGPPALEGQPDACVDTLGDTHPVSHPVTPPITPGDTPLVTPQVFFGKPNEINALSNIQEPIAKKEKKTSSSSPRGARLANDWHPSEDLCQWTRTTFPQSTAESLQREVENFRDYWTSRPGSAACKLDWNATWRVWCRRAFAAGPMRPRAGSASSYSRSPPGGHRPGMQELADAYANLERLYS
jgi:uncharacterized protein YdaU (DUF1376 family)